MGRAAGDSNKYELRIIDKATGLPVGRGADLPSVTTITKVIPKGDAMTWWGFKLGIKAVADYVVEKDTFPGGTVDEITEYLYDQFKQEKKLTPKAVMEQGGSKGSNIHEYAEILFDPKRGIPMLPGKSTLPPEEAGRLQSLVDWYHGKHIKAGTAPKDMEVIAQEVPVFSLVHDFAGTLDLILRDPANGAYYLIDFKTSKGIYFDFLLQVAAYEVAAKERGYLPPDAVCFNTIVRLNPTGGKAHVKQSEYTIEDFLVCQKMRQLLDRAGVQ